LELAKELSGKQEEVKSMLKTIDEWLSKLENNNSSARDSVTKLRDFLQSIVDTHEFFNAGAGSSQEMPEDPQSLNENLSSKKNGLVQKIGSINE
jgi:predicted nuclease with TOPRIM domain